MEAALQLSVPQAIRSINAVRKEGWFWGDTYRQEGVAGRFNASRVAIKCFAPRALYFQQRGTPQLRGILFSSKGFCR